MTETKCIIKQDIPEIEKWIILILFYHENVMNMDGLVETLQKRNPQVTRGMVGVHLQQLQKDGVIIETNEGYDLDMEVCHELITQLFHSIELILKWKRTPYQLTYGVMGDIQHPNQSSNME